jgi:hypothetical protein
MKSRLEQCQLILRESGDILFEWEEKTGDIRCNLYQYTIVPNEIYNAMIDKISQLETVTGKT